jgi:hypothetical protein
MARWHQWLSLVPAVLCMVSPVFGQTPNGSLAGNPEMNPNSPLTAPQPREFGVEDVAILNIGPCSLQPRFTADATNIDTSNCERVNPAAGTLRLGADVQLPAGAVITEVTIDYFDSHTTSNPAFGLFRVSNTGVLTSLFNVTVPGSFSGGNNTTTIPLSTPETVDNQTNNYIFLTILDRTGAEIEGFFRAAIKYRRQVSPAPAIATFNDVPTGHPFFQFIEALFASGITAGCSTSPPLFCPDAPLTRGQMAVFLSKALGLHFAP